VTKTGAIPTPLLDIPTAIEVALRLPAVIDVKAPLARALLLDGKSRGIGQLRRTAAQSLFYLVHQRLGRPARALLTPAGGVPFAVDCANTGFLEYARRSRHPGGTEPEISGLFSYLAPRLSVVYDIGANWGYYPLLFGTDPRFSGEVHAFEIQPRTAADLRQVVSSSRLGGRVLVHAYGLSDQDGPARLERNRHSYLARIADATGGQPTDAVPVRRLDGLDLPVPQLIKIDVEGHEAAVLRGGASLIDRHRPLIVFESWYQPVAEQMLEPLRILARLGYVFRRLLWQGSGEQSGRVELAPLALEERPGIAAALNLLAVHPAGAAGYF
jgi:FkbM family methyltransferase